MLLPRQWTSPPRGPASPGQISSQQQWRRPIPQTGPPCLSSSSPGMSSYPLLSSCSPCLLVSPTATARGPCVLHQNKRPTKWIHCDVPSSDGPSDFRFLVVLRKDTPPSWCPSRGNATLPLLLALPRFSHPPNQRGRCSREDAFLVALAAAAADQATADRGAVIEVTPFETYPPQLMKPPKIKPPHEPPLPLHIETRVTSRRCRGALAAVDRAAAARDAAVGRCPPIEPP